MWELDHKEGWELKNWCFPAVVLEKMLESPLNTREIKPVNPKGNQLWIFIEGLVPKLKLQYFGHLVWRADSLEKTLMLGKIEGKKRRGQRRMKRLNSTTDSKDMNLSKFWDIVKYREAWHAVIHGVTNSQAQLSDWTTKTIRKYMMRQINTL